MDLARIFEEATSSTTTSINSLENIKLYPMARAKTTTTKYVPTALLNVRYSESSVVQIFLFKVYSAVI